MVFVGLSIYIATVLFVGFILPLLGLSSEICNTGVVFLILLFLLWDMRIRSGPMSIRHIPRVPSWPVVGSLPYISVKFTHRSLAAFSKQLGPLYKMLTASGMMVFACDYETIREVCIVSGKKTAGRPLPFLTKYMLNGTGILFQHKPNNVWKSLRMESHKHLKQFGEGMSRLEDVITEVAEEMFQPFKEAAKSGESYDPKKAVFDAALLNIAYLITGVRNKAGDEIVERMRNYEKSVFAFLGATNDLSFAEYDARPWIRHFNLAPWKTIEGVKKLQELIWRNVEDMNKSRPEIKSLYNVLMKHVLNEERHGQDKHVEFSDEDVKMTVLSLLLAGVTTTSTSFYAMINVLAHQPKIQDRMFAEVKKINKLNDPITLLDRQDMSYCRAALLEILRYASVVPMGVPHRTVTEVEIGGLLIPEDTVISTNLWALHHDPDFWADPYTFIPERFLDSDGNMVPADHPNRKHLMPFGAGPRVCLGESLALARLFLWITTLVQRFRIEPGEDNNWEKSDSRNYEFDGVVRVCPYKVKFVQRETYLM